jgi:hypothetical protein
MNPEDIVVLLDSEDKELHDWIGVILNKKTNEIIEEVELKLKKSSFVGSRVKKYGYLNKKGANDHYHETKDIHEVRTKFPQFAVVNHVSLTRKLDNSPLPALSITNLSINNTNLPYQGFIKRHKGTLKYFCELKFNEDFYKRYSGSSRDYAKQWTSI